MRRFHAFLLAAGLLAAPAHVMAGPSEPPQGQKTLGVMVMSLTPELRTHFGSTDRSGVLVGRVEPGSPAALAGIAVGDVITEVHGAKVDDAGDVLTALAASPSGKRVTVRVLRDAKARTFDVSFDGRDTQQSSALEAFPQWLRQLFKATEQT